jgi:ADP-ribose pyrophosphatase
MDEGTKKGSEVEILCEGRHLRFVRRNGWEFVERKNITGIGLLIAFTERGGVLFVDQWREPVGARVLELPAGLVGDDGEHEDAREAANRELEEETGYRAAELEELMSGPPSPGVANEIVTVWLARGLTKVGEGGGVGDEDIVVHEVPAARVLDWLEEKRAEGYLIDPKTYGVLALANRRLGVGSSS